MSGQQLIDLARVEERLMDYRRETFEIPVEENDDHPVLVTLAGRVLDIRVASRIEEVAIKYGLGMLEGSTLEIEVEEPAEGLFSRWSRREQPPVE